jgi:hypothetical protein
MKYVCSDALRREITARRKALFTACVMLVPYLARSTDPEM